MKTMHFTAGLLLACLSAPLAAQDKPSRLPKGSVEPVLLEPTDGGGAQLGLRYDLKGQITQRNTGAGAGAETFDPLATLKAFGVDYTLRGTVTANSENNPHPLQEARLDAHYRASGAAADGSSWAARAGVAFGYEAAQGDTARQSVITAFVAGGRRGLLDANDFLGFDLHYGQVDPSKDTQRSAALGSTALEAYNRAALEALYQMPLKLGPVEMLEVNYRLYRERNAPEAVRAAKLDRAQLITYRLGLTKDLFIAYARGRVPLDRASDQVYSVGLSYVLK